MQVFCKSKVAYCELLESRAQLYLFFHSYQENIFTIYVHQPFTTWVLSSQPMSLEQPPPHVSLDSDLSLLRILFDFTSETHCHSQEEWSHLLLLQLVPLSTPCRIISIKFPSYFQNVKNCHFWPVVYVLRKCCSWFYSIDHSFSNFFWNRIHSKRYSLPCNLVYTFCRHVHVVKFHRTLSILTLRHVF